MGNGVYPRSPVLQEKPTRSSSSLNRGTAAISTPWRRTFHVLGVKERGSVSPGGRKEGPAGTLGGRSTRGEGRGRWSRLLQEARRSSANLDSHLLKPSSAGSRRSGMEVGTSGQTPTRVLPSPAFTDFLFSSLSPGSELQTTSEATAGQLDTSHSNGSGFLGTDKSSDSFTVLALPLHRLAYIYCHCFLAWGMGIMLPTSWDGPVTGIQLAWHVVSAQ